MIKYSIFLLMLCIIACQKWQEPTQTFIPQQEQTQPTVENDTTDMVMEQEPVKENNNEEIALNFDNLIEQFSENKEIQNKYTKFPIPYIRFDSVQLLTQEQWIYQKFHFDDAYGKKSGWLMIDKVAPKDSMKIDERVISFVKYKEETVKSHFFQLIDNQWFLVKVEEQKLQKDTTQEDFFIFLHNFLTKPNFQKQRIFFPLKNSYNDLENIENGIAPIVHTTISKKEWSFVDYYYNNNLQNGFYCLYENFSKTASNQQNIVVFRAYESCGNGTLTFELKDNQWLLVELHNAD